jgi:N6-adenosine-specific RNA methylase IME4
MAKADFIIDPEFRAIIPALLPGELETLEASLQKEGCRDSLVTWDGILLDGHNRFSLCQKHDVPFSSVALKLPDRNAAKIWIVRNQFGRRNLTPYQRCELALELEPLLAAEAKERQGTRTDLGQNSAPSSKTREQLAKLAGVSHDTIARAKVVRDRAGEQVKEALRDPSARTSLNQEYQKIKTEDRRQARNARNAELTLANPELTADTPASVLLCDPPWLYDFAPTDSRLIENQYSTMSLEELCGLDISKLCTPDAVLFCWATSPKLEESLIALKAWGFTYRTCAIWDKKVIGMGYYFRQQHELLLVATQGNLPPPAKEVRTSSIFRSRRKTHSRKPECVYRWIEQAYPDPLGKRELFAREQRPGWLPAWGNELPS